MKLFSKRNNSRSGIDDDFRYSHRVYNRRLELVSTETRNRIASEIKFLTSSDDYLEWFILFENRKKEKIFFDKSKIDSFSLAELGYKMSDYFELEDFKIIRQEKSLESIQSKGQKIQFFDDYKLFDLAEIVILFAKDNKRTEIIERFNSIFIEENADFQIIEHLITKKSGETLETLVGLLKDDDLKNKINKFHDFLEDDDYLNFSIHL